jgi:hypothetical protein
VRHENQECDLPDVRGFARHIRPAISPWATAVGQIALTRRS